jgi:glycosyltransferase involved in cell wall biosynthesis
MTSPNPSDQNQKPKALLITRFPYESSWGGEESHTLGIAKHFRKQGHEVIFMGSCEVLLKKFEEEGFPTKKVWGGRMIVTPWQLLKSLFFFPFLKKSLKRGLKSLQKKYDIGYLYCLSLNEKLFLTPYALEAGIKTVWIEHQEIRNWLLKNSWRKRYQDLSKKVKIVPISKNNEKHLKNDLHVKEGNLLFINNGIEIKNESHPTKKKLGSIVFANRLIPKKGVMDFLECISLNKEFFKKKEIMIVGEGEQAQEANLFVKENLKELSVSFSNYLKNENWKRLLEETDIFVSCARDSNETFSLNSAEALSKGCKVVVTKCSGIADFLVDKKEAFLCEGNNPEDLFQKIKEASDAPDAIREMARHAAKRKFNKETMLKEYYELITNTHD